MNDAAAVDDEERPLRDAVLAAVRAIASRDRALRLEVGEERVVQATGGREGAVTPDPVDRDADDGRAMLAELREDLVVQRDLIAADRAPVRRVEHEDDRLPLEVGQRHGLIRRRGQRERGRLRAGSEDRCRHAAPLC